MKTGTRLFSILLALLLVLSCGGTREAQDKTSSRASRMENNRVDRKSVV